MNPVIRRAILVRMNRYLDSHPVLRKWFWFIGIYVVSVVVFGIVAFALQLLVPK